ncbi:hypothetical protein L083_6783 [Actinoplanes sp. N902-109]|nr:hypothetical protein L083_6783 [Actinoplanes sp. N902-109]
MRDAHPQGAHAARSEGAGPRAGAGGAAGPGAWGGSLAWRRLTRSSWLPGTRGRGAALGRGAAFGCSSAPARRRSTARHAHYRNCATPAGTRAAPCPGFTFTVIKIKKCQRFCSP